MTVSQTLAEIQLLKFDLQWLHKKSEEILMDKWDKVLNQLQDIQLEVQTLRNTMREEGKVRPLILAIADRLDAKINSYKSFSDMNNLRSVRFEINELTEQCNIHKIPFGGKSCLEKINEVIGLVGGE